MMARIKMAKIKMCGLFHPCDIRAANEIKPEYIGFVFSPGSRRYVTYGQASELKALLEPDIRAVGVFVDENPKTVADLLDQGVIDIVQLHGREDESYIKKLRTLTDCPVIQAFCVKNEYDAAQAQRSTADYILLDSGAGTGTIFDWKLIQDIQRPYFLAGGLSPDNVGEAVRYLYPYAVDVSSGIETDGRKDKIKMAAFAAAVRKEEKL
ncbi:phosphoribosylanthranilate isomerase [Parablautia intestinalis]|jgi:phosphoribosylanthranilate isomerase|uniref:phosphoribosylanthranilate isomerase n=1 Tax=Parablautia intestinalis TaxID=2320100 RepID=UPI002F40D706